ncbi:hypothetical protein [Isoptericola rhizosphaerae]|uniref:hypothetical protein n=1 Tax=Isoptericola rhizosphaerae TaxID=3377837 RepID=UPI00383A4553
MAWSEWQGVIGALGGVAITGIIGLLTARLTHGWRREEHHEVRRQERAEVRRTAYAALLVHMQGVVDEVATWMDSTGKDLTREELVPAFARDLRQWTHELDALERRALLLVGPDVEAAITAYLAWFRAAVHEVLLQREPGFRDWETQERPVMVAMRREIDADVGISDEQKDPWWKFW